MTNYVITPDKAALRRFQRVTNSIVERYFNPLPIETINERQSQMSDESERDNSYGNDIPGNTPVLHDEYRDMFEDIQSSLSEWLDLQGFEQAYELAQIGQSLAGAIHNLDDLIALCQRQTPDTEELAYQSFYLCVELCNSLPVTLATYVEMKRALISRRGGKA